MQISARRIHLHPAQHPGHHLLPTVAARTAMLLSVQLIAIGKLSMAEQTGQLAHSAPCTHLASPGVTLAMCIWQHVMDRGGRLPQLCNSASKITACQLWVS